MFENERERGVALALLPREERDELVTRLMFGRHAPRAREALGMLLHAWGIQIADISQPTTRSDRE
jgi:hypothetical protein